MSKSDRRALWRCAAALVAICAAFLASAEWASDTVAAWCTIVLFVAAAVVWCRVFLIIGGGE